MAAESTTTPVRAIEDAFAGPRFTHSDISEKFSEFLRSLAAAIEAERDIERGCPCHFRFDSSLTNAEMAWDRVTSIANSVFSGEAERRSDRTLQRMALLLHSILGCETREEFDRYTALLASHPHLFQTRAIGGLGWRISAMLESAKRHLADITGLDMIRELETVEDRHSFAAAALHA